MRGRKKLPAETEIRTQDWKHYTFYGVFAAVSIVLLVYYLSNTLFAFTSPHQFPINSFTRFPLSYLVFPAELFSIAFALYFVYNLLTDRYREPEPLPLLKKEKISVAILLPVYNEPKAIVDRTITACKALRWPGTLNIYLLDDSTNDADKKNMAELAKRNDCTLVRRKDRVGYKAGNLNNAVSTVVKEDYFVIFDSDQAPLPEFLETTMDYFSAADVGFVQVPQHFIEESTALERAAKIGANIFFQAQCVSKARDSALPFCGTNAVIRTKAFKEIGGFAYYTATEDIDLGMRLNAAGYHGKYVPRLLVHGYAPPDFIAYSSQQYRWANGNLAILREHFWRLLQGDFSFRYQVHMFFTVGWWLIGITTLLYIIVPLLSLFIGGTHHTWLPTAMLFMLFFNVMLGVSMICVSLNSRVSDDKVSFWDAFLQYSLITNSMFIYTRAALNALVLKRYIGFVRTNKKRSASSLWHVKWNLLFAILCFIGSIYALFNFVQATSIEQVRTYLPISIWLLFYTIILSSSILFVHSVPDPSIAPSPVSAVSGIEASLTKEKAPNPVSSGMPIGISARQGSEVSS